MDDQNIKRRRLGAVSPGFFAGLALAFDFSGSARRRVLVVSADEMLRTAWGNAFGLFGSRVPASLLELVNSGPAVDSRTLSGDWRTVGQDIRGAMQRVDLEQSGQ